MASTLGPSAAYPEDRRVDVALRDGATLRVRPARAADAGAVREFLEGVSRDSIGFRFFGAANLDWATRFFAQEDQAGRLSLLAETGDPARVIAHAIYAQIDEHTAEVAFLVADAWQDRGIATILLAHLAEAAEAQGITTFTAEVLPSNHRMVDVFRKSGFPVEARSARGAIEITLPTSLSPGVRARFEERERTAAVAAVRSFLAPRSVAVVGASRRRGTVGGEVLHNLLEAGFTGPIYPVNARADSVQSLRAYPSVSQLPGPVELAVIAVPADQVLAVAHDCAQAGVRALLVLSAGFRESGTEGTHREDELLALCRNTGMRLVGPNCFGVLNTSPAVNLNAIFGTTHVRPGRAGLLSQSGGVGLSIMIAATRRDIGLSSFVSVGNKVDISGNDLLQYWEQDEDTDVVLLYLESVGNPRKFARIAPRVARSKPVLSVKGGRSVAGARAASSHTGALLSASDVTIDALFQQAGVIRADTLPELLDVAELLTAQPLPRGGRLVIVTNGGGPGILCTDAALGAGMSVPELPAELQQRLRTSLPPTAAVGNPVDMIATATAADYGATCRALLEAGVADALLAIYVPALDAEAGEVAAAIREAAAAAPEPIPVAAVFMTAEGAPPELRTEGFRIPNFEFPENAARAMALAARNGRWRERARGRVPTFADTRADEARGILSRALGQDVEWLSAADVFALLDCYGLPTVPTRVVTDVEQAVAVASEWPGRPLVLKGSAHGLVHKSDIGAVRTGLSDPGALRAAAEAVEENVRSAGYAPDGFVLQPQAGEGVELLIGVVNDPSFGPVLACGAGGTAAELLRDVAVRITPVTDLDAGEMLRSLRTFPLLTGYRGTPACDLPALEEMLVRVAAMVEAHHEVAELDLNPVRALPDGAQILDARIRIQPVPPPPPMPSLRA
ncbi:MAG TPA: GNAT family N-acetyltransferase [Solirubrobacteraceae bacterium]